jgi:hypothetical protein
MKTIIYRSVGWFGLWCFTPLSTIFIMVKMMDDVGKTSLANRDLPATYLF